MAQEQPESRRDLVSLDRGWAVWPVAALRGAGLPFTFLDRLAAPGLFESSSGQVRTQVGVDEASAAATASMLGDSRFLTALVWQNPKAAADWVLRSAADAVAGRPIRLERMARRQALLARYAQRYAAKNDTIGFFGPVGWARLDGAGSRTELAGDGEIDRTDVYLETWAVAALGRHWSADPRLRPDLPVRLDPACHVEFSDGESRIHRPRRGAVPLERDAAALVAVFAGAAEPTPMRVVCETARIPLERGHRVLAALAREGVVRLGFRVPIDSRPEEHLRRQVTLTTDTALRTGWEAELDELSRHQASVAAAGTPDDLLTALTAAEHWLAKAAGPRWPAPVTGPALGRRTPMYMDSRRRLDARVGTAERAALAAPLSILLDSARWLCGQIGELAEDELRAAYGRLRNHAERVSLADLQLAAADLLSGALPELAEIAEDFRQRWATMVAGSPDDGEIVVDPQRARSQADALFPPRGRWWAAARVHSPDLLLAQGSAGLYWILGELHLALNTLESRVFRTQADDPGELVRAVAADMPVGRVVPLYPADAPLVSSRTYPPLSLDPAGHYHYWSYDSDDGHPTGAASTPATGLVVTEHDGELVAHSSTEGWTAPVLECFGEFLTAVAVNQFQVRTVEDHCPRVRIGSLVVCRETWALPLAEVNTLLPRAGDRRFTLLRKHLSDRGIPRHVFARVPGERKPYYVDLCAPLLLDNFARSLRRAARAHPSGTVQITEMLPGPDQLWLHDADGNRYTSELRLVAVDPQPAGTRR